MAKSEERLQAISLRKEGESIKVIAKKIGVSSSSVSAWTRNIVLSDSQRRRLEARKIAAGHKGRMLGSEMNRQKRLARIAEAEVLAQSDVTHLGKRDLFFIGLGLYWGEGVKAESSNAVALINSDPRVIRIMMRWFTECLGVERGRFMPRVFISDTHRDREEIITRFWMKHLGIPRKQFGKMIFLNKGKKIYENHNLYYGVLALRIAKGSDIRYRILAQIQRVADLGNLSSG